MGEQTKNTTGETYYNGISSDHDDDHDRSLSFDVVVGRIGFASITEIHNDDSGNFDSDSDYLLVTEYLNGINDTDIKFCRIRLLNGIIFFFGSLFYVVMDSIGYSGLYGPTAGDDDDLVIYSATDNWFNVYGILYFIAASLFILTAIIDLWLVHLGTVANNDGNTFLSEEVQQQIINREQARVRAKKMQRDRPVRIESTMMGLPIIISQRRTNRNNRNGTTTSAATENTFSSSITSMLSKYTNQCCTDVVIISWTLLFAGLFGVLSSILVVKHIVVSDIFNLISVHLFFIQACAMVYARLSSYNKSSNENENSASDDNENENDINNKINDTKKQKNDEVIADDNNDDDDDDNSIMIITSKCMLVIGDLSFFMGALIDIVMSYIYAYERANIDYLPEAIVTLMSGLLWLLCSIVYLIVSVYDYQVLIRDVTKEMNDFRINKKY
jgi:hypothetical protein